MAVTGGIGSGKSTASTALAAHGAVVVDSDRLAREVVEVGSAGLAAVTERFTTSVLAADGSLDRAALAAIVFAAPAARRDLEAIIHPAVRTRFVELAAAASAGSVVVNDIPLLTRLAVVGQFHLVVGVGAADETRIQRLIGRGLAEADARARLATQIDDAARQPLTDVWLDNNGTPAHLEQQVTALWRERLTPFNQNLLAARRAVRPGPAIVAADPTWSDTARRLMARVAVAVGDGAAGLHHIGSTAVAGLPAKNVIDLQLGVRSLDEAQRLSPALAVAGFVEVPDVDQDTPHPAGAVPADWRKTFHANTDPGRPVNLHLRVTGGPGWTFALQFVDWLRSADGTRADYLALKQRLATEFEGDADGYARAKEAWFAAAWATSTAWAASVGWSAPAGFAL